jgi:hypothetical protein
MNLIHDSESQRSLDLGLDDRGSFTGGGNDGTFFLFSTASRPALESIQSPIQWVPGLFFRE